MQVLLLEANDCSPRQHQLLAIVQGQRLATTQGDKLVRAVESPHRLRGRGAPVGQGQGPQQLLDEFRTIA